MKNKTNLRCHCSLLLHATFLLSVAFLSLFYFDFTVLRGGTVFYVIHTYIHTQKKEIPAQKSGKTNGQ